MLFDSNTELRNPNIPERRPLRINLELTEHAWF
jgi:hypothetical protein